MVVNSSVLDLFDALQEKIKKTFCQLAIRSGRREKGKGERVTIGRLNNLSN
jgi:hypothetical protein